jgi:hypothetical protein
LHAAERHAGLPPLAPRTAPHRYTAPTDNDLGRIADQRSFWPAVAWAVALLIACAMALLDERTPAEIIEARTPQTHAQLDSLQSTASSDTAAASPALRH